MSRRSEPKLLMAAINTGLYGTDAISNGSGTAMQTRELAITAIEGETLERELDDGKLGHKQALLVGTHVKVTGQVEIAGSGSNTTAPGWEPIIVAGGYESSITADTDESTPDGYVTFERTETGSEKDVTFYAYRDGQFHKITGARLTFTSRLNVNEIPVFDFEITGLYAGIVEGNIPGATFSNFSTPAKVGATYTELTIDSTEYKMLQFELNETNEVVYDENTVEEAVYLTNYKPEGRILIEAPALSSFNPYDLALNHAEVAIKLTHGTAAGNKVTIDIPKAQIMRTSDSDQNGRLTYEIPFRVLGEHTFKTE